MHAGKWRLDLGPSINSLSTAWLSRPIGGINVDKCYCGSTCEPVHSKGDSGISEKACANSKVCGCQRTDSWAAPCCPGISAEVWKGGSRGYARCCAFPSVMVPTWRCSSRMRFNMAVVTVRTSSSSAVTGGLLLTARKACAGALRRARVALGLGEIITYLILSWQRICPQGFRLPGLALLAVREPL